LVCTQQSSIPFSRSHFAIVGWLIFMVLAIAAPLLPSAAIALIVVIWSGVGAHLRGLGMAVIE
jgi:hypothetical protein